MTRYKYLYSLLISPIFICFIFISYSISSCKNDDGIQDKSLAYYHSVLDSVNQQLQYSQQSFHFIDSVFAGYKGHDFSLRFKYLSFLCGYYHIGLKDEDRAMAYADTMLMLVKSVADSTSHKKEEALANISKGDILFAQKKYNDAYFYYYLGKVAAKKSLDACTYSEYSYRLAMVMYKTNNYQNAATFFKQGFVEAASCDDDFRNFYRRQELLNNTALSYARNGDVDSAAHYYDETLKFINDREKSYPDQKNYFNTARGVIYGNIGQLYTKSDFAKAEALFKKSIAINASPNHDINDALGTQIHLAFLYYNNHKPAALDALLKEIKTGLDSIKDNDKARIDYNELMWRVSDEKKQVADAYKYLLEYSRLKSIEAENTRKLSKTDIAAEIKSLEADYNVKLLKKDSKLQNVYFLITSGLFVMCCIILTLIWGFWRRSRKNVQKLTDMNNQVQFQKEELEAAFEMLEIRDKEKDKIFQMLAHDLKNPIAGIHSLTTMLEDDYREMEPLLQMFELIKNGCNNALELINEILECTAYEQQSEKIKEQVVDVNRIVNNCCRLLRFKASEKKQALKVKFNPMPQYIKVHPSRLFRVLNNLITNAVKFSPAHKNIIVEVIDAGTYVHVKVQDEGIGVPEGMRNKLFQSNDNIKRHGTAGEKSYGMGLVICKQIMDSYNGSIWFESVEGKGTSFFISFPKHARMIDFSSMQAETKLLT